MQTVQQSTISYRISRWRAHQPHAGYLIEPALLLNEDSFETIAKEEMPVSPPAAYVFHHSATESKDSCSTKSKRYTSLQWLTLLTLAFGNFCVGACVSLQAPFFPQEAEKKGATPTEYGLIFGFYQLTIFLTAPAMGKLMSFTAPKFLLNSGIFAVGTTCVCFGLLDMINDRVAFVGLAFAIRILEGVGAAALRTSCYAIIAAQFTENMGTTFAVLETFLGIGLITGPTLGGALYDVGGYGLPFYSIGTLVLFDAVIIFFVLPSPEQEDINRKGNWLKFWLNPGIVIYAFTVFTCFNYIGFNQSTLEPHVRQFRLSGVYLGMMFALSGTLYAATAPLWGWLCDKKCNSRIICIFGCFIMIISLLLIGPMPFLHLESRLGITIASLALMGIAVGAKLVPAFSGSMKDTIERGFPSDLITYGLISSMFASSQSLGAFVGPSLGGYMMDVVGYDYGVLLNLCMEIVLVIVLLIYTITKEMKKRKAAGSIEEKSEAVPILSSTETPITYS